MEFFFSDHQSMAPVGLPLIMISILLHLLYALLCFKQVCDRATHRFFGKMPNIWRIKHILFFGRF